METHTTSGIEVTEYDIGPDTEDITLGMDETDRQARLQEIFKAARKDRWWCSGCVKAVGSACTAAWPMQCPAVMSHLLGDQAE